MPDILPGRVLKFLASKAEAEQGPLRALLEGRAATMEQQRKATIKQIENETLQRLLLEKETKGKLKGKTKRKPRTVRPEPLKKGSPEAKGAALRVLLGSPLGSSARDRLMSHDIERIRQEAGPLSLPGIVGSPSKLELAEIKKTAGEAAPDQQRGLRRGKVASDVAAYAHSRDAVDESGNVVSVVTGVSSKGEVQRSPVNEVYRKAKGIVSPADTNDGRILRAYAAKHGLHNDPEYKRAMARLSGGQSPDVLDNRIVLEARKWWKELKQQPPVQPPTNPKPNKERLLTQWAALLRKQRATTKVAGPSLEDLAVKTATAGERSPMGYRKDIEEMFGPPGPERSRRVRLYATLILRGHKPREILKEFPLRTARPDPEETLDSVTADMFTGTIPTARAEASASDFME